MASTLSVIKTALRVPSSVTMYDDELNALIEAATAIMSGAGVDLERESVDVINAACICYVKANFGSRADADRNGTAFNSIVKQRALVKWGDVDASNG